ncbi:hypothetical protein QFZ97_005904 [Paraburkholderia youngii]
MRASLALAAKPRSQLVMLKSWLTYWPSDHAYSRARVRSSRYGRLPVSLSFSLAAKCVYIASSTRLIAASNRSSSAVRSREPAMIASNPMAQPCTRHTVDPHASLGRPTPSLIDICRPEGQRSHGLSAHASNASARWRSLSEESAPVATRLKACSCRLRYVAVTISTSKLLAACCEFDPSPQQWSVNCPLLLRT